MFLCVMDQAAICFIGAAELFIFLLLIGGQAFHLLQVKYFGCLMIIKTEQNIICNI